MDIKKAWPKIRAHFSKSFSSSLHVSIASLDAQNNPTCTPIGSLFLNDNLTGFYFEMFPSKLPNSAIANNQICILGVNSDKWFWIRSLFKVKFSKYPAIKLYGTLGEKRKANPVELSALSRRMRRLKMLKGYSYLWKDMQYIRELNFTKAEIINLGKMTHSL